jgi:RNA polymerase sigma-70 factor (ECF subfamily)
MQDGQPPPSDWELVKRARGGDHRAFHDLVDRHGRSLFGLAVRLVGDPADAEEVVQETFAGAFRGLRAFRGQASVKTWLTQILVRQTSRHHRRKQRRRHEVLRLDRQEAADPAVPSGQKQVDLQMDLSRAILELVPEHRQVIVMRGLQGMTYDEMAVVLGVPRGTVESRLFRARRRLQELLKGYLG